MLEQLEDLESKLIALIENLQRSNMRIQELEQENQSYREMLEEAESLNSEAKSRENVIKNKLSNIMEKLDGLESDMGLFSREHV